MKRYMLFYVSPATSGWKCVWSGNTAMVALGLVAGTVRDSSTGKNPPYVGWNKMFSIDAATYLEYNLLMDITDKISEGPVNPGGVVTIASKWEHPGAPSSLNCFGKIHSRNHPEELTRPAIDIYEVERPEDLPPSGWRNGKEHVFSEGCLESRTPIGDTYFQTDVVLDPGVGLEQFLHILAKSPGTAEEVHQNYGISFRVPEVPETPPIPPPPIEPMERIGIRGM